jgi:NitT/TauT family transport system ATP-binding protein
MKLSIENLSFAYDASRVFSGFSLAAAGQGPLAILGPSGCGKTTLLKLRGGLLAAPEGNITLCGSGGTLPPHERQEDKARQEKGATALPVSFVFQEPRLLPWRTVLENIALPLRRVFKADARDRASAFLEAVNLGGREGAYPEELSGGEKQRVSLARAFAYPASLILMDEPFQSVDIPLRIELMKLTLGLLKKEKRSLILVTHDPREALCLGKRIIVLGGKPCRVVFDRENGSEAGAYVGETAAALRLEQELIDALEAVQHLELGV